MKQKHIDIRVEQCLILAKASNCPRQQFGALLLDPKRNVVLMDGYNGGPRGGGRLCGGEVCLRDELKIEGSVGSNNDIGCHHAELNVVCNAAANGVATMGAWMICNGEPCIMCAKIIHHSGIKKLIVVAGGYGDKAGGIAYLQQNKVEVQLYKVGTDGSNEGTGEGHSGEALEGGADVGGGSDGDRNQSRGEAQEEDDGTENRTARVEASDRGTVDGERAEKETGSDNGLGDPSTASKRGVEAEALVFDSPDAPVTVDAVQPWSVADLEKIEGRAVAIAKKKNGVSDVHVTYNGVLHEYMCLGCAIMRANLEGSLIRPSHTGAEICETVYAMHYHLRVHAKRGHLVDKSAFRKLEKHMNRERKTDVTIGRKIRRKAIKAVKEERQARKRLAQATFAESTPSESASNDTAASTAP